MVTHGDVFLTHQEQGMVNLKAFTAPVASLKDTLFIKKRKLRLPALTRQS